MVNRMTPSKAREALKDMKVTSVHASSDSVESIPVADDVTFIINGGDEWLVAMEDAAVVYKMLVDACLERK